MQLVDAIKKSKLEKEKAKVESELAELKAIEEANEKEKQQRKQVREQLENKYRIECTQCYVNQNLALRVWKFLHDFNGDPSRYEQLAKAYLVHDFFEEFNRKYPGKKQPRFTEDNEQIAQ